MADFQECCGDSEVVVTRVILFNAATKQNLDYIRGVKTSSRGATEYKALSKRFNNTRRTKRDPHSNEMQFKANAGRQIASTIRSTLLPGDTGPLRSPVRSAFYRTVTPGRPGGRGGRW